MAERSHRSRAADESRVAARDGLDDFPTPPWATRALCELLTAESAAIGAPPLAACSAWEPAANRGYMVRPLREYFGLVEGTDVKDYGAGFAVENFMVPHQGRERVDWILTNPPFRLGADFIERMSLLAPRVGYGVLVRTAFLESEDRWRRIYRRWPPSIVAQYVERVPMFEGVYDPTGSKPTSFAWLLWFRRWAGPTEVRWIAPCRARLELESDLVAPFAIAGAEIST